MVNQVMPEYNDFPFYRLYEKIMHIDRN